MNLETVPAVAPGRTASGLHPLIRIREYCAPCRCRYYADKLADNREAKKPAFLRKNKVENSLYVYLHAKRHTHTPRPVAPAFLRSIPNIRTRGHTGNQHRHGTRTQDRIVPEPINRPQPVLPPRFERPFANTPHAPLNWQIEPPCGPVAGPRNHCRPIMLPQDSGVD